jgi:hypothetical protein
VDTAGRIDKFKKRYEKKANNYKSLPFVNDCFSWLYFKIPWFSGGIFFTGNILAAY